MNSRVICGVGSQNYGFVFVSKFYVALWLRMRIWYQVNWEKMIIMQNNEMIKENAQISLGRMLSCEVVSGKIYSLTTVLSSTIVPCCRAGLFCRSQGRFEGPDSDPDPTKEKKKTNCFPLNILHTHFIIEKKVTLNIFGTFFNFDNLFAECS